MEITLKRITKTDESTIGHLHINGVHQCFVIEDKDRGLSQDMELGTIKSLKVHGKTAIPKGRYEVVITFSNRFQKNLPLLLNVPGFEGIRIHPGNTAADTEGCLLPGTEQAENKVLNSRAAFTPLFEKIKAASEVEKVFITIE